MVDPTHIATLGEGWTPLLAAPRFGAKIGVANLLIKDEGLVPTGSFKARGAAVGVSRARELGVRRVAMPTNDNAGAAWATYAARAGLGSTIAMPLNAPAITRRECLAAGAELHLIDGLINDAGRHIAAVIATGGGFPGGEIFDAGTLREPYRLEGKKTMGYEIVEQLGWIGTRFPRLVAVQSTGCAPVVRAFAVGASRTEPWVGATTVAFGINVPAPLGDELILAALRDTGGTAVAVDDAALLRDLREFAAREGLLLCPEGAACLTAARQLRAGGWIRSDERVVVINTGAGIKYPDTVDVDGLPVFA